MKSFTHLILLLVATIVTVAHCRPDKSIVLMILDHGLDEPCDKDNKDAPKEGPKESGKDNIKDVAKEGIKDAAKEGLKDAAKEGMKEAAKDVLKESPPKDVDEGKIDEATNGNAQANDSPRASQQYPMSRAPKRPTYQRAPRIRNNQDNQAFQ